MKKSPSLSSVVEHGDKIVVTIKKPSLVYLDLALRLKCFPEMLRLGIFPNAKEVTESMSMFAALRKSLQMLGLADKDLSDPSGRVLVVGDGRTPRTGAMVAMRSKWSVLSVDPALKSKRGEVEDYPEVERLQTLSACVEDLDAATFSEFLSGATACWVLAPHSHGQVAHVVNLLEAAKVSYVLVSMPCCYPELQSLPRAPELSYEDLACLSPERTINIWKKRFR